MNDATRNMTNAINDGFRLGLQIVDTRKDRERQARLDAMAEERHAAELRERGLRTDALADEAARGRKFREGVTGLSKDYRLGQVDAKATAAAQSDTLQAQGENYDSPSIARGLTADVRDPNKRLGRGEFMRRYADLGLETGTMDVGRWNEAHDSAKGVDFDAALSDAAKRWNSMTDEERNPLLKSLSTGNDVPGYFAFNKKTNRYAYMTEGGATHSLTPDEAGQLFALGHAFEIDPVRASEMQRKLRGEARKAALEMFGAKADGAAFHNRSVDQAEDNARQDRVANSQVRANDARATADRYQLFAPQMQYRLGPDGRPVPIMTGLRMNTRGTGMEAVETPLPGGAGLIPAAVLDPSRYRAQAETMVGQPSGVRKDGQLVRHTVETATRALMDQAIAGYTGRAPSRVLDPAAVAATRADLDRNGAPRSDMRTMSWGDPATVPRTRPMTPEELRTVGW